jgi:tetratricopeptide (TPR) repeat protein
MIGLAVIAKRQNRFEEYYARLCEIYKIEPDHYVLNIYLAEHYFYKRDYIRAKKLITQGLKTIDSHLLISKPEKRNPPIRIDITTIKSKYYYMLGFMAHDNDDKLDNAFRYYKMAIDINPENSAAHFGLGQVYLGMKNYQSSIECFESIVNSRPEFECNDCFKVCPAFTSDYGLYLLQVEPKTTS